MASNDREAQTVKVNYFSTVGLKNMGSSRVECDSE